MVTIIQETEIKASAEKIWQILWNDDTYKQWTNFFSEGCYYESDWQIGGRTLFLDATGKSGMISTIDKLDAPHEVVFKHLGYMKDGEEIFNTKEVAEWSGAQEKYFLREIDENTTELRAIVHTFKDMKECMNKGFIQGFEVLKKLAEA